MTTFQKLMIKVLSVLLLISIITQSQTSSQQAQTGQQPIKLNVLVTDSYNRLVDDVKRDEFSVFEDDVPQTISFFSTEELPLVYGIAIDNSGSFKNVLKPVVEAVKTIISNNKPDDETFLARFISSDHIETVMEFSSDRAALIDSLNLLKTEQGQTALIDAIYVSVQQIAQYKKADGKDRRRALIIITDGEDRASFYTKDQLIDLLRSENVQIFTIGIVDILERKSKREQAINLLNSITKESGGLAFFPKSPFELGKVANEMMPYLRKQYVIGYIPSGKGGRRKISVKVADNSGRNNLNVITRQSYKIPRIKR